MTRTEQDSRLALRRLIITFVFTVCFYSSRPATGQNTPHAGARVSQSERHIEAARLNNLGVAYMNQQLFEKALAAFQKATAEDIGLAIARMNQGIALLNLQRLGPAQAILEKAVKLAPDDPFAWYNLGLLYRNQANVEGAATAFRRVIAIDSNDADAWYFLGATLAQGRQFQEAIEAFQHALKINPLHASAEFGLARAQQQSGNSAGAREHLGRFQHITEAKLGSPVTLAYGDQGKYSLAEQSSLVPQKVPPTIPVRFVDVSRQAGLRAVSGSPEKTAGSSGSWLGPGACFLDYDGDGNLDLFLADNGPEGGMALFHNIGGGKFQDVTRSANLDPSAHGVGCAAGDFDNDGATDLAISLNGSILLLHNEKNGTFKDVAERAGIKSAAANAGIAFIDYDHDGDLDLYVSTFANEPAGRPDSDVSQPHFLRNLMFRNNGDGTFTEVAEAMGLSGSDPTIAAVGTDYNNDRAIDILETGGKNPVIFENRREGPFVGHRPWPRDFSSATTGVAILDFDHDGWMDVAFTHSGAPGISLWRNLRGKGFEQVSLPDVGWVRGWGVTAIDYDNDGWIDLAAVGETADHRFEIRLFRNLGPEGFKDITAEVGLDKIKLENPRALIAGDYDGDGATDLLVTQQNGPALLLRNEGGAKNNALRLALSGLADNKSAIGTKVEVFSDGIRQTFEIAGSSGYLGEDSPSLNVGLGKSKSADIVRMLWPSGVLEDEVNLLSTKIHKITELDRRGSSCPTLFAWDGTRYALVADLLGAGVVGHWIGPNQRDIPRPVEYIKISRQMVQPKNGRLSFRFMEPLEEVVYADQVKLLAVDHPSDLEVFPNEYFAANPPYPEFKVVFSRDARLPAAAWDDRGRDALPDLKAHRYFGNFDLLSFHGFTKLHYLDLDLGAPYQGGPLWLLMHGEVEYFTATSMFAAYQAGVQAISPYVEALDASGKWVRVIDDMGFPAGGARTMTADLSGKLPPGTRRIRIATNLQIYWDGILIDRANQDQPAQVTSVPLVRAGLAFHGFPLKRENKPPGNVDYIYAAASPTGPYTRPEGSYTRYGDVLPLLTAVDDRFVIFGSGDEIALDFDPSHLPSLPQGWSRDYFFAVDGYEKDMDFYAATGDSVAPLPFLKMKDYPLAESPAGVSDAHLDDVHLDDALGYNTRYSTGREFRKYSFAYPSAKQ